jgi:hypothetical protein
MLHITSVIGLKEAIEQIENEKKFEGLQVKKGLMYACKNLMPFHSMEHQFNKTVSPINILENIIGTAFGLFSIFLQKRLVNKKSGYWFSFLTGSVMQFIVLNLIAQRSDKIKTLGRYLIHSLLCKIARSPI